MLTSVAAAINQAARAVTLRHPNAMDCVVYRRRIKRVEIDPATGLPGESADGMPTLGGMTVIAADDEPDFDYDLLGPGKVIFTAHYAGGVMNERMDAPLQEGTTDAQIEPIGDPGTPEHFDVQKGDLVAVMPGLGVVLAYTCEFTRSGTMIPGHVMTSVLQPRDDLHQLLPYLPGQFPVTP